MLAITSRHNSTRSLRLRRQFENAKFLPINYKFIAIVFQHGLNNFERAFLLHKKFCKMRKIIEIWFSFSFVFHQSPKKNVNRAELRLFTWLRVIYPT